jgi:hypothetical protein
MSGGCKPAHWRHEPPAGRLVNTVPAAVEMVLAERPSGEGMAAGKGGNGAVRGGSVYVGRGLHEWKQARLIVGGWRADPDKPYQGLFRVCLGLVGGWRADPDKPYESREGRLATVQDAVEGGGDGGSGDGGAEGRGLRAPPQEFALHVRAEQDARTWGLWFLEPESGGSVQGLLCGYSMELDDEVR